METVLLTEAVDEVGLALLRARPGIRLVVSPPGGREGLAEAAREACAIGVRTARLDAALLSGATRLRVVAKHGVGTDNIDIPHLTGRGIPVTNTPDANAVSVAEHAMMLMLATARRVVDLDRAVKAGDWAARTRHPAVELAGRRVLVVGVGRIGRRVAALCRAFGMAVTGYDPEVTGALAEELGIRLAPDLDCALSDADIVTLHVPLSAATRRLFDAERIGRLRPGAILINCARGGVVDEDALAAALAEGRVAAAGFDVLDSEPPRPDDMLLRARNVVLTPHSAALTLEAGRAMAAAMARNILDGIDGRLDPAVVVNAREIAAKS